MISYISVEVNLNSNCSRFSERERTKPSDVEWLKTVANSGTLGDKIAALAIQIQV
jgi:hypothetical protein